MFRKTWLLGALAGVCAGWMVCGAGGAPVGEKKEKEPKVITTKSGLKYQDTKVGTGAAVKKDDKVKVHYTGWLYVDGKKGKKFDSSHDRGEPFEFTVGAGMVIKGWDEGLVGVKTGGKRTLIIPPGLAYGKRGAGRGLIPPDSTLLFEVELVKIEK